jgi:hypothetical protein
VFRTQRFIETDARSGSRKLKTQNVHIEHTVPVKVLRRGLSDHSNVAARARASTSKNIARTLGRGSAWGR